MSHTKVIIISIISGILLGVIPFLAYTQKPLPTIKKAQSFNSITYIATGRNNEKSQKIINNLFDSTTFVGDDYIAPTTTVLSETIMYNTGTDDSITRYVSRDHGLQNKKYEPLDLVSVQSKYLTTSGKPFKLRKEASENLIELGKEFYQIFDKKLVIVSAYRSYGYQANLKKNGCSDTLCAPAGHSEHQLGLAVDLFAATTADKFLSKADFKKYYDWLAANAHRYGRHNTYQKGVEIDTYQVEPRHWRYVGRELATELYDQKMTFGEWVDKEKN